MSLEKLGMRMLLLGTRNEGIWISSREGLKAEALKPDWDVVTRTVTWKNRLNRGATSLRMRATPVGSSQSSCVTMQSLFIVLTDSPIRISVLSTRVFRLFLV